MKNFEELIDLYSDMIIRIAFQIVKNQADAEDVCQEVFIKLLKAKEFESEEHRKAWIIRVTVNKSKDLVKSSWFKNRAEFDDNTAVYEDEHLHIVEEVMNLPIKYRTPIYLYYFEGYSVKEIADIFNKSPNTVLSWLNRGRKKLEYNMLGGFENE